MERTDQELVRIEKANRIREMGMDPFGHRLIGLILQKILESNMVSMNMMN